MAKLKATELKAVAAKIAGILSKEREKRIEEEENLAKESFWQSDLGLGLSALMEEYPDEMKVLVVKGNLENMIYKDVDKFPKPHYSAYSYTNGLYGTIHEELIIKNIGDDEFDFESLLNEFRKLCLE